MNELHTGDIRWFFDEDLEKAFEVKIKCKTIEEWARSSCYWCTVLETGNESIFESRFLYKSKDEAIDVFINKLKEDIKDKEKDLKVMKERITARIEKQKALIEKLEKQKENQK